MTPPLLPDLAAAPLQAMSRASMRHRVTLESFVETRLPNGEYEGQWVTRTTIPCLLHMGGSGLADLAAARGVKAEGTMRVELREPVYPGERGLVRGVSPRGAFQHLVTITSGANSDTNRLFGLATVVDADLNQ